MCAEVKAVLFDLDGTLVDSAPDLVAAINFLRKERGLGALPLEVLRPVVGAGARGMIGVGFGVEPSRPEFEGLKNRFLELYELHLLDSTCPFADVVNLITTLTAKGCAWGIVTNKATRFAQPIVRGLAGLSGAEVLVCGDTTPFAKPHPAPLLHACELLGLDPSVVAYVGDDLRDIEAGRAAGVSTVAVRWGYLGQGAEVDTWGADFVIDHPLELLKHLNLT